MRKFFHSACVLVVLLAGCAQEDDYVREVRKNLETVLQVECNARMGAQVFAAAADDAAQNEALNAHERTAQRKACALFRALECSEQVHIALFEAVAKRNGWKAHRTCGDYPNVDSVRKGIEDALRAQDYESQVMFPAFVRAARRTGDTAATEAFSYAAAVEQVQAELFRAYLENAQAMPDAYHVCQRCGIIETSLPAANCQMCGAPPDKFKEVR